MSKLEVVVKECLKNRIVISGCVLMNNERLGYEINGFSKSGSVVLYQKGNRLLVKARYDEISEIETFDELVDIAYDWYIRYKDRSPFNYPDCNWLPLFLKRGLVKQKIITDYE